MQGIVIPSPMPRNFPSKDFEMEKKQPDFTTNSLWLEWKHNYLGSSTEESTLFLANDYCAFDPFPFIFKLSSL